MNRNRCNQLKYVSFKNNINEFDIYSDCLSSKIIFLKSIFRFNEYIDGERKRRLSQITNIPEHQIKVWFQNRRQKKKREQESDMPGGGLDNSGSGMGRYESMDESMHGAEGGPGDDDDGNIDGDGHMNKNYSDADYNNEEEDGSPNNPEVSHE